jgi:release factor glutamine methyltransferase
MTLSQALERARRTLALKAIEDAPLEAELLLRHTLKINRTQLYLDLEKELSPEDEEAYQALIERRLAGEPSAYITGHREFYGRDFFVNHHTLIPRPESELLVEKAIEIAGHRPATIADIGTGGGAIAVTIALELPQAKIYATDISAQALEVAKANCQRYGVSHRVILLQGDMLEPLPEKVDLIVANLPYVRRKEIAADSFEPLVALDGGAEGTESITKLCRQAKGRLKEDGTMLLEVGQGQSSTIQRRLQRTFADGAIEVFRDLGGIERVVALSLAGERVAP